MAVKNNLTNTRLPQLFSAIDKINAQDPNHLELNGKIMAKELIYGQRMTFCLNKYWPKADEILQIAVRAQHIKRWHIKRCDFPKGKTGYYSWRIALGKYHAELTELLMADHGYSCKDAEQTAIIIRKEKLKTNLNSQTLEDVACLVFLEHYFDGFAAKHSEEKIIRIIQLTWKKMSKKAQDIALTLNLPEHLTILVSRALT